MLYICTKFHENIPLSGGALIKDEKMVGVSKPFQQYLVILGQSELVEMLVRVK